MSVLTFTWNGQSSDDYGIEVMRLPGGFIAAERVTDVIVPGRSGTLHITDHDMDEQILQIDCYLPYEQGGAVAPLEKIAKWLRGDGILEMSSSTDGLYMYKYKGRIINGINANHIVPGFDDVLFSITVSVEPYRYTFNAFADTGIPGGQTIVPAGRVNLYAPWEPTYRLRTKATPTTGTGTLEVKKGSETISTITGHDLPANKYVVIDTANKIITIDGTIVTDRFEGDWPTIPADTFAAGEGLTFLFPGTDNFFSSTGNKVQLNRRCY